MSKIVLMYHDVYVKDAANSGFQNGSAFGYKISVKDFEEQVAECSKHGNEVIFTFDDGGISFYEVIAPILEKYGQKGVFFISTQYIDTDKFLSRKQVKEIHDRGHIIGSHSNSHPMDMAKMSQNEIFHEWQESLRILSDICGCPIVVASIPNGVDSMMVKEMALKAGIQKLYTSNPTVKGKIYKNKMRIIGRYVVREGMDLQSVSRIVESSYMRSILHIRWVILRAIKCALGGNYNKLKVWMIR